MFSRELLIEIETKGHVIWIGTEFPSKWKRQAILFYLIFGEGLHVAGELRSGVCCVNVVSVGAGAG